MPVDFSKFNFELKKELTKPKKEVSGRQTERTILIFDGL